MPCMCLNEDGVTYNMEKASKCPRYMTREQMAAQDLLEVGPDNVPRVPHGCEIFLLMRWMRGLTKVNMSCAAAMEEVRNSYHRSMTPLMDVLGSIASQRQLSFSGEQLSIPDSDERARKEPSPE